MSSKPQKLKPRPQRQTPKNSEQRSHVDDEVDQVDSEVEDQTILQGKDIQPTQSFGLGPDAALGSRPSVAELRS